MPALLLNEATKPRGATSQINPVRNLPCKNIHPAGDGGRFNLKAGVFKFGLAKIRSHSVYQGVRLSIILSKTLSYIALIIRSMVSYYFN
jgi:hypothetical protein